ncbi:hypothetical protein SacmaDRAFT_4356 [Saccharomonospora marina XMU15]|uniref:Lipoprotein n=1 Tax=Saccharomonospora marina XMU15 TaxID=882083 RepID=H5X8W7_9PSEU|nr:hypothetical protein [Saccharomonospora marina]EHR52542.1 hypothetical protein SacmaDRAFT_4356 [Saccharomonospora marina XMU15]
MRKSALAASGFALVLALSACGGGTEGGTAIGTGGDSGGGLFTSTQDLVQAATERTNESQSSKFTMEMDMAGQQMTANGEALYAGADSKMSMSMEMQGQSFEIRLVDKAMYMKMPDELASQMDGKTWIKISADGTDPLSQQLGGTFDQMAEQSDPRKTLEYVQQAGEITKSEETTLDGQDVTHYWIELDYAKISDDMAESSGITKEQAKQLADKVGKLPMELWLNGDNLPVQVSMDMGKIAESMGAPGQGGSMVMKYTDWGAPVNVEAPPADQIGEMPSF